MSTMRPDEWLTHYHMEPGRGCSYSVSDGRKVPLAADGVPNPYVCMDPMPPILEAMRMGDTTTALQLIRTRPDIDADEPSLLGTTALMAAASSRHMDVVRSLLGRACDVHRSDELGCTALLYAAGAADAEIVSMLLEHRANANQVGVDGRSALHICAAHGLEDACSVLLRSRANLDALDEHGLPAWKLVPEGHAQLSHLFCSRPSDAAARSSFFDSRSGIGGRLLLLPCLGGFAEAQFPRALWQSLEDQGAAVVRVDYPGHGSRAGEQLLTSMEALADFVWKEYVTGVQPKDSSQPWAIIGHSMGAVVAYEVARRAQTASWRAPTAVILAAAWPPHGYGEYAEKFWSRAALEDDAALVQRMVDIGGVDSVAVQERELQALLVPIWRADLEAELGYKHKLQPRLRAATALRVLAATEDATIAPQAVKLWADCADNVEVLEVPGGHFLHLEGPSAADFVERVRAWLSASP